MEHCMKERKKEGHFFKIYNTRKPTHLLMACTFTEIIN